MRVVVVGAGAVGLATAYRLARDGHEVTVLDAARPGQRASSHNAGWVVPIMSTPVPEPGMVSTAIRWMLRRDSPLHVRPSPAPSHVRFMVGMLKHCNESDHAAGTEALATLNEHTMRLFGEYMRDGADLEWHEAGLLMTFLDAAGMHAHARGFEPMARIGHTATVLSRDETLDLEPALSPDLCGAISCPGERHLRSSSFVAGLQRRCEELGVEVCADRPVTSFRRSGGTVSAAVAGEELHADAFVLAAGVWTAEVARLLGLAVPIRPGKGYGHDFKPEPTAARHALYLSEAKVAVSPLAGELRLAGTMEFGRIDESVDGVRARAILAAARRYVADWDPAVTPASTWSGMRPMTPDGLPCIGWLRPYENVVVASGHAMLGITLAPVTAEAVGDLFLGLDPPQLAPFDPGRFTRKAVRS